MPLIDDENGSVKISYSIPVEIRTKIPDYFYYAFYGELCALYGAPAFTVNKDGDREVEYYESTSGWNAAFWAACKNTEQYWLYEYYEQLPWYDSDMFDDEICSIVIEKCNDPLGTSTVYYDYLTRCMEREGKWAP